MATATLDTVLGIQVFAISGRPLDLGLLGLAAFAPAALLVLVTGSVADRFDRRRVVASAHVAQAATGGALFFYLASEPTTVTPIFAFAFVYGTAERSRTRRRAPCRPTSSPRNACRGSLPAPPRRGRSPRSSAPCWVGSSYAADPQWPYVAVVVLMLASAALVLLVPAVPPRLPIVPVAVAADAVERPAARAQLSEAVEGFRFVRSQPIVLGAISLDLFAVLFGGAVALLPALAEDRLHVGAVGIGWLRGGGGIGAALVTLRLAIRPLGRHVGRWLLSAVATFGVATIVLGLTRSYAIAFVAMFVLAGADSISVFVRATLVPLVTPASKRGPRARGRGGLHRCVERAGRLRVRRGRPDPRAERSRRARRRRDARGRARRGLVRSPRSEASIGSRRRSTTEPRPDERCRPARLKNSRIALTTFPPPCRNAFSP